MRILEKPIAISIMLVLAAAFLVPESANAVAPTQYEPGPGVSTSDYMYMLPTNSTYVKFGSNFYVDEFFIDGTHVSFTNIALSSASNPTQTFGIGVGSGNATISQINAGSVVVTMSCAAAAECNIQYYTSPSTPVSTVRLNNGIGAATSFDIPSSSFATDSATFMASNNPAVYYNSAGGYYQVRMTYSDPTLVTFFLAPESGGGGGGGGPDPFTVGAVLPAYGLAPGASQERTMTITVTGTTQVTINSLTFTQHPEWFTINKQLPFIQYLAPNSTQMTLTIPITLNYPATESVAAKQFDAILIASSSSSTATVHVPVKITTPLIVLPPIPEIPGLPPILSGPPFYHNVWNLALLFLLLLVIAIIIRQATKRKRSVKVRIRRRRR